VLGLPGLLATLSDVREEPLPILGPAGLRAMVDGLVPLVGSTSFALDVREVEPGERLARDGYALVVLPARHVCPALGWALVEDDLPGHMDPADPRGAGPPRRGRRLVLSGDTRPAAEIERAAAGADLLVHEATFLEGDRDLADRAGHSTAAQAAELAARAGVAMLALTHLSSRYPREDVLAEARTRFASSVAPADLDSIEVPLPERGPPRLVPGGGRAHPGRAGAVP
jgi:ribonuclease Z